MIPYGYWYIVRDRKTGELEVTQLHPMFNLFNPNYDILGPIFTEAEALTLSEELMRETPK